jgi:hypothetical protein
MLVLYKLAKTCGTFETRVPTTRIDENGVPKKNKGEAPVWEFPRGYPKIIGLYCFGTLD